MNLLIALIVLLTLLTPAPLCGQSFRETLPEQILPADFEIFEFPLADSVSGQDPVTDRLVFHAWNREFDIRLEPARLFTAGAAVTWVGPTGDVYVEAPAENLFQGHLADDPNSVVRLDLSDGTWKGLIAAGDDIYLLDGAAEYFPGMHPDDAILYRLSDLDSLWEHYECATETEIAPMLKDDWSALRASVDGSDFLPMTEFPGALLEIELQLVIDSYYYYQNGSASAQRAHSLIHLVNGIFERELGVTLRIAGTRVSLSPAQDGLSATKQAEALLQEFVSLSPQAGSDLAHLITGRNLNGATIGLSWTGSVCNTPWGSGLSQGLSNTGAQVVLTAHELGHNLGAGHDGSGLCRDVPRGYIMWPVVSASHSRFSACSRTRIDRGLQQAECLAPLSRHPLPAPMPVNPRNAVNQDLLTFVWQETRGAQGYFLEIFDESQSTVIYSKKVLDTILHPALALRSGQTYYWRIAALDEEGLGERTAWQPFSVYSSRWRGKSR